MNIGITGATGHLGRLVINKLKEKSNDNEIIALAHTLSKAADFDIAVREADYTKPETLNKALEGIDTLMFISASEFGKRKEQHHNIIEAAQNTGVKRIVYTSLLHADTSPIDLAVEHRATEQEIKLSGIPFTFLRNGWYFENYTGSIDSTIERGVIPGSADDGKYSFATRADYADVAVKVLLSDGHTGQTYELAGDNGYTLGELAEEISKQSGKKVVYKNVPKQEYVSILESAGLPGTIAKAIAGWDICASEGALFDDNHQLSKLIGHPTTTLSVAVAEALG